MRTKWTQRSAAQALVGIASVLFSLSGAFAQVNPSPPRVPQQQPQPPAPPVAPRPDASLFPIPPVIERPLDLEAGARIRVSSFKVEGLKERPELSIRLADVDALLYRKLRTAPEAGFTINQLQTVADGVTEYLRDSGMMLAKAVIPAQDVRGGVVVVRVLEGLLENVRVEGNRHYSTGFLQRPFKGQIGEPVSRQEIEAALLHLNSQPGLQASGRFAPGEAVGTTTLAIEIRNEEKWQIDAGLDNYGTETTGEYRGSLGFAINNLLDLGDRMRLYAQRAFDPSDSNAAGVYGGLQYQLPIGVRYLWTLSATRSTYDVGGNFVAAEVAGEASIYQIGLTANLWRSRVGSSSIALDAAKKVATVDILDSKEFEDRLTVISLAWNLQYADELSGTNWFSLAAHRGIDALDAVGDYDYFAPAPHASRGGASGEFTKFTASVQRLQSVTSNSALLVRISGQYCDDLLLSLEQMPLGGPDAVRAYPSSDVMVDSGGLATVEWIFSAPGFSNRPAFGGSTWGQVFQVSLFGDYGKGKINFIGPRILQNPALDLDPELSGVGIGLQLAVPNSISARLDVATALGSREASNERSTQYFLRLAYKF